MIFSNLMNKDTLLSSRSFSETTVLQRFGVFWVCLILLLTFAESSFAGKKHYIKFSTLAPEGSSWMNQMRVMDKKLRKQTKNKVAFKFYSGGVSGDEKDVIRKMRIGQIHSAGFTGVGLGQILPEVRVLDLPFLFRNDKEVEYIYEKMTHYFANQFEKKGYILLGWVPVGWVHFFSNRQISTVADLQTTKSWMWEGDPLVQEAYSALKVSPFPLSITDVLLSLQTGMIDTVYASPVGALALQWFTKVKYMSQVRMGNSTGAVLMSKRSFKKLPKDQKEAFLNISRKCLHDLMKIVQKDNEKSIAVMLKNGLLLAREPNAQALEEFHNSGEVIQKHLTGKLFSKKLLDTVLGHLKDYRNK